jgi:hypothetical protein
MPPPQAAFFYHKNLENVSEYIGEIIYPEFKKENFWRSVLLKK